MTESPKPYVSGAVAIERALSSLEGWSFGRWFEFTTLGYFDELAICLGGWNKVEGFKGLPGICEFAKNLDAAVKPICDAYAAKLRQELANECVGIAANAVRRPGEATQ